MYTDQMIEALKAGAPWDLDSATAFAETHGLTPRSVVSKVGALGLKYIPRTTVKPAVAKPKVLKADLVKEVQDHLNISLPSLEKMTISDLNALIGALKHGDAT